MSDQATTLRLAAARARSSTTVATGLPAIAVTGGKGGVGKTCIAVNLAALLAQAGLKPLLVDLDLGLANADILLGVSPQKTLADVLHGRAELAQAVTPTSYGFPVVPAASGRDELTRLPAGELSRLMARLGFLLHDYDLAIFDTAAGIGREVLTALRVARMVLVVVTPDPTSLADAYAVIKLVEAENPGKDVRVVVNNANSRDEAHATFIRLSGVARKHLGRELVFLGDIPADPALAVAIRKRRLLASSPTESPALVALRGLANRLKGERWK